MNTKSITTRLMFAGALALSAPVFAASPTVHEVYLAAEAGKYAEAQTMMDQVLKEHPNSSQAHFVEAELMAKQGKFAAAQKSLATAERLSPGLPKVNATSVANLKALIAKGESGAVGTSSPNANYNQQPPANRVGHDGGGYANRAEAPKASAGIPWGSVLLIGGVLVAFIFVASRFMQRRQQQNGGMGNLGNTGNPGGFNPGNPPAPGYPPGGYPQQGYPQQGYPQQGYPQQGPGMGSRIMGGLATGAAVGAGFMAAEAIARNLGGNHGAADSGATDGGRNDIIYEDPARSNIVQNDDMGGNDFGVSGGWDDAGGSGGGDAGGDDWN